MKNGKSFIESLEYIINEEYIDFQIKFEVFIEDNFNWVFLLSSNKYLYIISNFNGLCLRTIFIVKLIVYIYFLRLLS